MSLNYSLQELCKDLHQKIDVVDEARYDLSIKVDRNDLEVFRELCHICIVRHFDSCALCSRIWKLFPFILF